MFSRRFYMSIEQNITPFTHSTVRRVRLSALLQPAVGCLEDMPTHSLATVEGSWFQHRNLWWVIKLGMFKES